MLLLFTYSLSLLKHFVLIIIPDRCNIFYYFTGAKVGLALGMLILGAVISAVATLSIIRLKSRNEDHDMKVEFVNNPEADSS